MKNEKDNSQLNCTGVLEGLKNLEETFLMMRLGNKAIHEAREENHRLGLPNIFSRRNGKLYFEYLDGTITQEVPDCYKL